MRFLTIALAASLLSGCAGREEVSTLAQQSSGVLNDYRKEMSAFAKRQTSLGQGHARRIGNFRDIRERLQSEIDRQLLGWRLANDEPASKMFSEATQRNADAVLASSTTLNRPKLQEVPPVKFDAGKVEAIVKQLRALQRAPSLWDHLAFAFSYSEDLHEAYKKSLEAASTATENTETDATAAAEQVLVAAPSVNAPNQ